MMDNSTDKLNAYVRSKQKRQEEYWLHRYGKVLYPVLPSPVHKPFVDKMGLQGDALPPISPSRRTSTYQAPSNSIPSPTSKAPSNSLARQLERAVEAKAPDYKLFKHNAAGFAYHPAASTYHPAASAYHPPASAYNPAASAGAPAFLPTIRQQPTAQATSPAASAPLHRRRRKPLRRQPAAHRNPPRSALKGPGHTALSQVDTTPALILTRGRKLKAAVQASLIYRHGGPKIFKGSTLQSMTSISQPRKHQADTVQVQVAGPKIFKGSTRQHMSSVSQPRKQPAETVHVAVKEAVVNQAAIIENKFKASEELSPNGEKMRQDKREVRDPQMEISVLKSIKAREDVLGRLQIATSKLAAVFGSSQPLAMSSSDPLVRMFYRLVGNLRQRTIEAVEQCAAWRRKTNSKTAYVYYGQYYLSTVGQDMQVPYLRSRLLGARAVDDPFLTRLTLDGVPIEDATEYDMRRVGHRFSSDALRIRMARRALAENNQSNDSAGAAGAAAGGPLGLAPSGLGATTRDAAVRLGDLPTLYGYDPAELSPNSLAEGVDASGLSAREMRDLCGTAFSEASSSRLGTPPEVLSSELMPPPGYAAELDGDGEWDGDTDGMGGMEGMEGIWGMEGMEGMEGLEGMWSMEAMGSLGGMGGFREEEQSEEHDGQGLRTVREEQEGEEEEEEEEVDVAKAVVGGASSSGAEPETAGVVAAVAGSGHSDEASAEMTHVAGAGCDLHGVESVAKMGKVPMGAASGALEYGRGGSLSSTVESKRVGDVSSCGVAGEAAETLCDDGSGGDELYTGGDSALVDELDTLGDDAFIDFALYAMVSSMMEPHVSEVENGSFTVAGWEIDRHLDSVIAALG
eukprot:gene30482-35498_t